MKTPGMAAPPPAGDAAGEGGEAEEYVELRC
jgi:hypothetical protein